MSGGTLEYSNWQTEENLHRIEEIIEKNPYSYRESTIETLKSMHDTIAKANVFIHRIDWLLSDDDGEEDLLPRSIEDLEEVQLYCKK